MAGQVAITTSCRSTCFRLLIFSAAATVSGITTYISSPQLYMYVDVCHVWTRWVSVYRPTVIISQRHSSIAHALDLKMCDDILPKRQRWRQQQLQMHLRMCIMLQVFLAFTDYVACNCSCRHLRKSSEN